MSYTTSKAVRGQGAQLSIGAVPVFELKNIQYSGLKNDMEDITNLNSPGRFKEWQSTLIDGGSVSFSGNLVDSDPGQIAMLAALFSGTVATFTVQYAKVPGQTTVGDSDSYSGYVAEWGKDVQATKTNQMSGKIMITGVPTFTVGS